jgi:hypothetical protein
MYMGSLMQLFDGSYRIQRVGPGNVPIPFGHVRKDLGFCVQAVANAEPDLNLFTVGDMLSWNQYIETWSWNQSVSNGGYEEFSREEFIAMVPPGLGREFTENVLYAMGFGYDGSDPAVIRPEKTS